MEATAATGFKNNSLVAFFVLLTSVPGFIACDKDTFVVGDGEPREERPDTNSYAAPGVAYLALGDSYTIGEAVTEVERFPEQLVARLRKDSFTVEQLTIIARTGWTTDALSREIIRTDLPDTVYNLVSLLIGVNNQFRGRTLENYKDEFNTLLHQAIALAGNRPAQVIVLSIPDYGVTPYVTDDKQEKKIAAEIDAYNDAAAQICLANQVRFVNITPISRKAAEDSALIATDGLHPSGQMYKLWVDLMLPEVKEMLK